MLDSGASSFGDIGSGNGNVMRMMDEMASCVQPYQWWVAQNAGDE